MNPNEAIPMVSQPAAGHYVYEISRELSPGDKVVCIDAKGLQRNYVPGPPVEGHLYCVREVYVDNGQVGILLVGIRGPTMVSSLECGFWASRFRWVHN